MQLPFSKGHRSPQAVELFLQMLVDNGSESIDRLSTSDVVSIDVEVRCSSGTHLIRKSLISFDFCFGRFAVEVFFPLGVIYTNLFGKALDRLFV